MLSQRVIFLIHPYGYCYPDYSGPIFYIHEGEHPFCLLPDCICHANEGDLRALLQSVLKSATEMRKVYNGVIIGKECCNAQTESITDVPPRRA